jgi:hypothetical protein
VTTATTSSTGTDQPAATPLAFSVSEFCRLHSIGRSLFYVLVKAGQGPRTMRVGRRTLISIEAAEAWRRGREAQAGQA